MGSQKVRQVRIVILWLILIFKQRLDLRLLRGATENRVLSRSKSVRLLTIKVLWSDFTNRAWGNALIILLVGSNRFELESVIWVNPKLTDRKVQSHQLFLNKACLKCNLSESLKELSGLITVTSTNMCNSTNIYGGLLFLFDLSFRCRSIILMILNKLELSMTCRFLIISNKSVIWCILLHVFANII